MNSMIQARPAPRDTVTMSSRDIATLVESRHADVCRAIERLMDKSVIEGYAPVAYTHQQNGRTYNEYRISKRDSYVIVAQLSPEFTARLVDRWQALESSQPRIPQSLPEALRLAADLADENMSLRLVTLEQAPKVAALDRLADTQGTMCLTDAAKHLGMQRKQLLAWMRENRWIYRREGSAHWVGYQPRLNAGLLDHKVTVIGVDDCGDRRMASLVRVTPKGLTVLAQKLGGLI